MIDIILPFIIVSDWKTNPFKICRLFLHLSLRSLCRVAGRKMKKERFIFVGLDSSTDRHTKLFSFVIAAELNTKSVQKTIAGMAGI